MSSRSTIPQDFQAETPLLFVRANKSTWALPIFANSDTYVE